MNMQRFFPNDTLLVSKVGFPQHYLRYKAHIVHLMLVYAFALINKEHCRYANGRMTRVFLNSEFVFGYLFMVGSFLTIA